MICKITGIQAEAKKNFETFSKLRPVGAVSLVHDAENEYDPYCIRVIYETDDSLVCLGYIPAEKRDGKYVGSELQKHIIENKITIAAIDSYAYIDDGGVWNEGHRGHLQAVTINIDAIRENDSGRAIGAKYMRVTNFISYFDAYGGGDELIKWAFEQSDSYDGYIEALNKTAEDGTALHDLIERHLRGEKVELPDNVKAFFEKYEVDPCYMEERFYDNTLGVTGQPDFVGFVNGELAVVDWKSSKKPSTKHVIQAAIYAKNAQWDGIKPEATYIVAFGSDNKQGFSVKRTKRSKNEEIYGGMQHLKKCMELCGVWVPEDKYWTTEAV
jgi:hypothetical protein